MSEKKYKLITISDNPLFDSGVALQARYIIDHLAKTGKFSIISIGAAMKQHLNQPVKTKEWGDDVVIIPLNEHGNKQIMRQLLDTEKPDAVWFITDPRFYYWIWEMEEEIRSVCPLIYWHVWDNLPYPKYNENFYKSTDYIACINKLTHNFLKDNGFGDKSEYLPHGVPEEDYFMESDDSKIAQMRTDILGDEFRDKFILFYNSRNALRKRTGNAIIAFKKFRDSLPESERDNVFFLMKTPPLDHEGQDLFKVVECFDLQGKVGFHEKRSHNKDMCKMYQISDCTISASTEEGFGLSILESLMTGTPVVCTKTGGMQDQAVDEDTGETFGFCIEPDAVSCVGSLATPYIYSDHVDPETFALKLREIYDKKKSLGGSVTGTKNFFAGKRAVDSACKRFNLKKIQQRMEQIILEQIEKHKERIALKKSSSVRHLSI